MTRTERIEFAITRFQRDLRLGDWDIRYDPRWDKEKDDHASALTRPFPDARVAVMRMDPDVIGDNIDKHIAHEMMHLVMWDLMQLCGNVIAKYGDTGLGVLDTMHERIEQICDKVAHALTGVTFIPVGKENELLFAPWCDRVVLNNVQGESE